MSASIVFPVQGVYSDQTLLFILPGLPPPEYDDQNRKKYNYRYSYVCGMPGCEGSAVDVPFENTK